MLRAINRPCYRSILALYLFAQTPVPAGISEDEELDGLNGAVCMQTAMCQLQQLRAQQKTRFCYDHILRNTSRNDGILQEDVDWEYRAYWAVITWETSMSLTSDSRTFLNFSRGPSSEPTWRLVKTFLIDTSLPKAEQWHVAGFQMTGEIANEIISVASMCNTYIWKNISSIKEALQKGKHDDVREAWSDLLEAITMFRMSIYPLLNRCQGQLRQLDQGMRLKWYHTCLQYHLGILQMEDALEVAGRSDLLHEDSVIRKTTQKECFHVIRTGLENTYDVEISTIPNGSDRPPQIITTSLVAIDPYPQYVIDCIRLMRKATCRRLGCNAITHETYMLEMSDMRKILEQLPQNSKSVQETLAVEFPRTT
jgi:hypothetical protein